jgi:hypothetical protein
LTEPALSAIITHPGWFSWFPCPNRQSSLTIHQNDRKTDFSNPATLLIPASFISKQAIDGKRKTFSENKRINVGISKYSKTSTSNDQHEIIIAQLEDIGCCSIRALNQAIT